VKDADMANGKAPPTPSRTFGELQNFEQENYSEFGDDPTKLPTDVDFEHVGEGPFGGDGDDDEINITDDDLCRGAESNGHDFDIEDVAAPDADWTEGDPELDAMRQSKTTDYFPADDFEPDAAEPMPNKKQRREQTPPLGRKDDSGAILLDRKDPMRSARKLVAARFTDDQQRRLLHFHRDAYWLFENGCYRSADDYIRAAVWRFLETARLDEKGEPPFKPTSRNVTDVIDALSSVCYLDGRINSPRWLSDADDPPNALELLPVMNGLLHLPTTELLPLTPQYFNIVASDVCFDPEAPVPAQWLDFLEQIFGGDVEAIATLQDWFGYTLSPDTSQQKMLMIVGPTRSGKGTIARINTALLGGYQSVATPTLASLQMTFGLEPLIGRTLGVISDARLSGRSDQVVIIERLLSLSGDDGIEAARKFKKAWTGRMAIRFMLLTNELPRLSDSSNALAKRFIILVLMQSFYGREDQTLTARLSTELPGILNWALVGYQRLRQRGYFVQPESGRKAAEQLQLLSSPVTAFVNDQCEIGPAHTIRTDLLYQSWRSWCEGEGRREPGTAQSFGRDLTAAFPAIETTNPKREHGGQRHRYYEGIELRPKEDEDDLL
jgi:putative DNA primase/helicase